MKCYYHKDKDALGFCDNCGKAICSECSAEVKEKNYCYKCMRDILQSKGVASSDKETKKEDKEKKEEKEKKRPGLVSLIGFLMILGGLLEVLINILAFIAITMQSIFNPSAWGTTGFVSVLLGFLTIYGILIMIAGKKLLGLKKWGLYLTLILGTMTILATPFIMPELPDPINGFYLVEIVFFVIVLLYLIKIRKIFLGEKSEKKKKP